MCHFEHKMQTMLVSMATLEAVKCKTFTQGLASLTLLWFHHFPTGSVDTYGELIRKFISNFSINVKVSKTPDDLFTIKQKNREPLRSCEERFNTKFINIPRCLDTMAVSAFKLRLQHGTKVKEDLTVKPLENLEEILSWARGFVKLEEENSQYWGNILRGRDLRKEIVEIMERG